MTLTKVKLKRSEEVHANKDNKVLKKSDSEISAATSCNPLECEPMHSEEFSTESKLPTADTVVVAVEILVEHH